MSSPKTSNSKKSPIIDLGAKRSKLGEAVKRADAAIPDYLADRTDDIQLTAEECKVLKQVVFRNHQSVLEPVYFKAAAKEVNSLSKVFARNVELCLYDIGPHKALQDVIRENQKDYKGLAKAVGYDSPNKKFKDIIGPSHPLIKPSTQGAQNGVGSQ